MATFGRNRQSIADIQQQLQDIFTNHPKTQYNDQGDPVIPADSLVDVFDAFEVLYEGVRLLDGDETILFQNFLKQNPGLQCTPAILVQYIAQKTRHTPPRSPASTDEDHERGRSSDRDEEQPRSPSSDSWSSSGPPQTPLSARSPFDNERRQRSTPLASHAPSSWTSKRPTPASRRKSDAGSRSDSEFSTSPNAYGRTPGRTRTPSNPTSPVLSPRLNTFSPPSRPHSRTQSHPSQTGYSSFSLGDEDNDDTIDANPLYDYRGRRNDDGFLKSISSLPMPHADDSDPDDEDTSLGLVMDRATTSSTASMEPMERLDALQRANTELSRKLNDAEKTLQNKLSEHESELEEMQGRLEEMRTELNATKREEKELRSKERQNMAQIGQLELEIAKVTKALEHARSTYTSLQRQYQEQCTASERYRDDLRQREELIRSLRDAASLHEMETAKWGKEHETYEARLLLLEDELSIAQQAHVQLDEQKQENLLLKETIDRMRFDMDEMRHNVNFVGPQAHGSGSGQSSAASTISKSLGAELGRVGKMKGGWGLDMEEQEEREVEETLEGGEEEGEETEGEDVIQTIITRTKRKVASRANRIGIETRTFEETKEYSDSSCQYDPYLFYAAHPTQTDPEPKIIRVSFSTQTDEPRVSTFATQTEPEHMVIPRIMAEMEVQTDDIEEEEEEEEASGSGSGTPSPPSEQLESLASSSSTIVPSPPTPRARPQLLPEHDEPPAYNQIIPDEQEQDPREWRTLVEILRKYHPGTKIPFEPGESSISAEAAAEWKALKEEMGVDCLVIDKLIEQSERTASTDKATKPGNGKRRASRFYNIYNTYVYGGDKGASSASTALWIGASALVLLAAGPYLAPQYSVPGGPTYYDRAAWSSFNSMRGAGEGFSPDGATVWNFLGRVGGEAARIARGWPT